MKRKIICLALLACLAWLGLLAGRVEAHASLLRSTPASGEVLAQFPASIELDFTEAVVPRGVRAILLDASGEIVAEGQVRVDEAAPERVYIWVPSQPDGVYSLSWHVVSAVDGHPTTGVLAFSVGASAAKASLLPPPGAPDPAADLPPALEVLLRAAGYLSACLVLGPPLFALLALGLVGGSLGGRAFEIDLRLAGRFSRLIQAGLIAGLLSLAGMLLWQAFQGMDAAPGASFGLDLLQGLDAHRSSPFWMRLLSLLSGFIMVGEIRRTGGRAAQAWWGAALSGGLLTLSYAVSGHNAATGQALPVIADYLHLAGMAAWIGGLPPLILLLQHARAEGGETSLAPVATAARRFSRLALVSVGLIALSGLYSAWVHVRTLDALAATRYGQAVALKTALFAVLVGIGAANQRILLPRLTRAAREAVRWLRGAVRAEVGVGLLVLLAAGAVMSLPPAYEALRAQQRMGYHQRYRAETGNVQLDLRIAPAALGENEFGVDVVDRRPGTETVEPLVLLRIRPAAGSGETQVEALPSAANRFTARGSYFARLQAWEVEVILRKAGFDDVRHTFEVDLPAMEAARAGEEDAAPPALQPGGAGYGAGGQD